MLQNEIEMTKDQKNEFLTELNKIHCGKYSEIRKQVKKAVLPENVKQIWYIRCDQDKCKFKVEMNQSVEGLF